MQSYTEALAQQINARKIEFIYFQAPASCLGNLISISLLLSFYWNLLPLLVLIPWAACSALMMCERWFAMKAYKKRDRYGDISPWYKRYNANVICNGLLWGILFLHAVTILAANQIVVMVIVLGALIAATAIAYHAYLRMYLNFAIPAFVPAGVMLLWQGSGTEMALGAVVICWLALMLSFAHQIRSSLNRVSGYEFSNVALLRELSEQHEKSKMLQDEIELKQQIIQSLLSTRHIGSSRSILHPA